MKRLKKYIFLFALSCLCVGCGTQNTSQNMANEENKYDKYQEEGGQVALAIDFSSITDKGYNQAAYEGAQVYAQAANLSYSYYTASADTQEAYKETVLKAIRNHAKLIICAGSHFEMAIGDLQNLYSDTYFLMLDGVPKDTSGNPLPIAPNVHCITYHEEEAGYLAGYMTVLEGYEKLGFIGGEQVPSVQKYGYGYLQGIDDAAALLNTSNKISVDFWYADTFLPNQQIAETSLEWYQSGTQVIFACGGALYQSVLASAEFCDGRLIGVDEDQNDISELFLTSAMKGVKSSVIVALDDFYANGSTWPSDAAGKVISYGAEKKCIELPFLNGTWRFKKASVNDYLQLLANLKTGKIQISDKVDSPPKTKISVTYHNK